MEVTVRLYDLEAVIVMMAEAVALPPGIRGLGENWIPVELSVKSTLDVLTTRVTVIDNTPDVMLVISSPAGGTSVWAFFLVYAEKLNVFVYVPSRTVLDIEGTTTCKDTFENISFIKFPVNAMAPEVFVLEISRPFPM